MRIGVDFDGTIADTNAAKSAWIERELGEHIPAYLCDRTSCVGLIGETAYRRMSTQVYERKATLALDPVDGALAGIAQLRKTHELLVMTARTGEMLESARTWLSGHIETRGLGLLGLSTELTPKTEACRQEGIEALVDDDERHLRNAEEARVHAILFKQAAPDSIECIAAVVCRSWGHLVRHLMGSPWSDGAKPVSGGIENRTRRPDVP